MVGYSDSNKDSERFSSQPVGAAKRRSPSWRSLDRDFRRAQFVSFMAAARTISRGALVPMHRFLRKALPDASLSLGDIRLTEQGETIAQKFGNLVTCAYNLELLDNAGSGKRRRSATRNARQALPPLAAARAGAARLFQPARLSQPHRN